MDISFPSGKIPINVLEKYSYCKKQGILSLRLEEKGKFDSKKRIIGRILHEVFKNFHEEWTDGMYNQRKKPIGFSRLKMILEAAAEEARVIMENDNSYLKYKKELDKGFKRMMEGRNGFLNSITQAAKHLADGGDTILANELPQQYFKGEPKFEWEVGITHPHLYGRIDCVVERGNGEFFVWEFKTGRVPDGAPFESQIMEAAAYAITYEEENEMKCIGLKILYYGEKEFNIAFSDFHRDKVNNQVKEIFGYQDNEQVPYIPMDNKCRECDYYDKCEKDEKVIQISDLDAEDDVSTNDSAIDDVEEIMDEDTETLKNPIELETTTQEITLPIPESDSEEKQSIIIANTKPEPTTTVKETTPEPITDEKLDDELIPSDAIGIVLQSEKQEYKLSLEKSNFLSGAIKQEFQRKVFPGQVLISYNNAITNMPSAIVELKEITSFPKTLKAPFRAIDMFNIFIETSPFMYYENEKFTRVLFPANFSSHYFRLPSKSEMMRIMNLFGEGINLGLVTYEILEDEIPDMKLIYKFPFSFKETGYKGIFVVGSPGKGKTKFLKILINGLSQYVGTRDGMPPAVIVLDITGQFGNLSEHTKYATVFDEELWKMLNMDIVKNLKVFKIIYNHGDGTHTLSLNAIDPELVSLLFPELPPTSSANFKRMVKTVFNEYPAISYKIFSDKINEIINRESQTLNSQVARAIKGAIVNGPIEVFDQGGIPLQIDEILVPGQVSVIQIDHILDKMPILLYLLLMINKTKIHQNNQTPLVLVLDEAHELFPKVKDSGEADYLRRVSQSLIRIARRGRKRHFGLVFASQQPHDIIPEIIGVFQTKVILGLEATSGNWIKETLGREYVNMILRLGQGYARVWNAELHKGTLVPLFIPKAPNKHEED